jgi:Jacalin-like lectin domain
VRGKQAERDEERRTKMPLPSFQCGPSGGQQGTNQFSDKLPAEGVHITAMTFTYGDINNGYLNTFQTMYSDGTMSERHGTTVGPYSASIALDPGEYITEFSGRYGDNPNIITVRTNLQTYERVFTRGGNQEFRYQVPDGYEVIGFMGADGDTIYAIGIIARALSHPEPNHRAE